MDAHGAIQKVQGILARDAGEPHQWLPEEFDVTEFPGGWLVLVRAGDEDSSPRGSAAFTVDRRDESVRRFSSAFPPRRIVERYDELKTQRPVLE
jgi:hypothetical protein